MVASGNSSRQSPARMMLMLLLLESRVDVALRVYAAAPARRLVEMTGVG